MDMESIVREHERKIRQAIEDYWEHSTDKTVYGDISDSFIKALASDSAYAKKDLRALFSRSPVWDEELEALVINGTRTHDPDPQRIRDLFRTIMVEADWKHCFEELDAAMEFFASPDDDDKRAAGIAAIKTLAPKAYAPGKKPSRVFKAMCTAMGVADEAAGSEFQKLYAQFADELTTRKIGFKLFVSINPAHFLTMSNPKYDERGNTLTSCHSFNSTDYEYNAGCTGYARDNTSFIVFTVADPTDPETFNNRKTTRQIFAYRPGNGVLLQSRMYNTAGGVYGAAEDSKLYRDLVQREISELEDAPNLWKTHPSFQDQLHCVHTGNGFGGYADWTYKDFDGHVSIRNDHADDWESIVVGTWGLCIACGDETNYGLYCSSCGDHETYYCDRCEESVHDEDDLYDVRNEHGDWIRVCAYCQDEYYTRCDCCDEYWPNDMVRRTGDGDDICDSCLDEDYELCEQCDEYYRRRDMTQVTDSYGNQIWVCEDCRDDHYCKCEDCGEYFDPDLMVAVYMQNGDVTSVCEDCLECSDEYEECPNCGEHVWRRDDGTCPACGAMIEEEDETDENDDVREAS